MPVVGRDDNRVGGYSAKRFLRVAGSLLLSGVGIAAAMMWFDEVERSKLFGVLGTKCQRRQIMRTRQLRAPRRARPMLGGQLTPPRSIGTPYCLATCSAARPPSCVSAPLSRASSLVDQQPALPKPSSATSECQVAARRWLPRTVQCESPRPQPW